MMTPIHVEFQCWLDIDPVERRPAFHRIPRVR
jgi:hypothetical protein